MNLMLLYWAFIIKICLYQRQNFIYRKTFQIYIVKKYCIAENNFERKGNF